MGHFDYTCPFDAHETLHHLTQNPQLQSVDLALLEMTDVEGRLIGEAVAAQKSLATLAILLDSTLNEEKKSSPRSMWPVDSFFTAVFLQPGFKSGVRRLVIAGSGTDGDLMRIGVLPQVLAANPGIRELVFQWHGDDGCSPEEIQELLEVIRNAPIETLTLPSLVRWDFPNDEDHGFLDAESFAQVVELVKHNASIHQLQLHIGECRGSRKSGDVINLDAFYKALSSNSSIRRLYLKGPFCTPIAETEFSNWIRTASSLQELQLEGDGDETPVAKLLFQALRENKSLRKLEMEDFVIEDEEVDEFLESLKVNHTLQEIVLQPECDRMEDVREALKKNLEQ